MYLLLGQFLLLSQDLIALQYKENTRSSVEIFSKQMDKITESLKIILQLGTQIQFFNSVIYTLRDNEDHIDMVKLPAFYTNVPLTKAVSGFLQNHQIIIICSLLDEFDKEITPQKHPNHSVEILKVKQVTKPIRRRISKWKDLKNYRNYILAHNLREKGTSIFSESYVKKTYRIPYSNSEHYLLGELAILIINLTTEILKDLVKNIDLNETLVSRVNFECNEIDASQEFNSIYMECIHLLKN